MDRSKELAANSLCSYCRVRLGFNSELICFPRSYFNLCSYPLSKFGSSIALYLHFYPIFAKLLYINFYTYSNKINLWVFDLAFKLFVLFECPHNLFKLLFGIFVGLIDLYNLFLERVEEIIKLRFRDSTI